MDRAVLPQVANATGEQEWYTPPHILEAARRVMGGIDLDPASSDIAQQNVRAKRYFTRDTDGLSREWAGRVWLNPPYSAKLIDAFVGKLLASQVEQAITLTNNATETRWAQRLLAESDAVCLLSGRLRFLSGPYGVPSGQLPGLEATNGTGSLAPGAPLQGQMICGIRVNVELFVAEFGSLGKVVTPL